MINSDIVTLDQSAQSGENLLLIWDAGAGVPFSLPLDQVTHIAAGGKVYRVQLPAFADVRPPAVHRRRYRWRQVIA